MFLFRLFFPQDNIKLSLIAFYGLVTRVVVQKNDTSIDVSTLRNIDASFDMLCA